MKRAEIRPEVVSVMLGKREVAESAIERFFGEFSGDVIGMLAYVDETTIDYLAKIRNARSFRILTSKMGTDLVVEPDTLEVDTTIKEPDTVIDDLAIIKTKVKEIRQSIQIWEITRQSRKLLAPPWSPILHARWISDGKIFVELGTDLKRSALGSRYYVIRCDSAEKHEVELNDFNAFWEQIQKRGLDELLGGPVWYRCVGHIGEGKEGETYEIISPSFLGNVLLCRTLAADPNQLLGQTFGFTLGELIEAPSTSYVKLHFQVRRVEGNRALTDFVGLDTAQYHIRNLVGGGTTEICNTFAVTTQDGCKLSLTPVVVTFQQVRNSVVQTIRENIGRTVNSYAHGRDFDEFVTEVVLGKTSKDIYEAVEGYCPIKCVVIQKMRVLIEPRDV